jgi:hypothetical protein
MRILLFLVIVLIVLGLPVFLFARGIKRRNTQQRESSWEGELIDKEHMEWEDESSPYTKDQYTLHFKTNEGKKVDINVQKDVYDKWEIGDRAKKVAGEKLPEIVK